MTRDSGAVASLKKFYKDKDTLPSASDVMAELMGTSDRAAVITLGAFLDDALEVCLAKSMRPLDDTEYDYAFRFDGPIGSFSARIDMCYWLKLIERSRREQLHDIREMRNACAHSKHPISFKNSELANVAKRVIKDSHYSTLASDLRFAFIAECLHVFTSLVLSEEHSINLFRKSMDEALAAKLKPSGDK